MAAVESQVMIPPVFPEKLTPVKSTLEFTRAEYCGTVVLRNVSASDQSLRISIEAAGST